MDSKEHGDHRIGYVKSKTGGDVSIEGYVRMLLSNGTKTFGEIRKHLKDNGAVIGTRGLHKLLDRLQEREIVKKITGKKYPLYFLTEKGIHDTGLMANIFRNRTIHSSLNNISSLALQNKETIIKKIVETVGLFTLYTHLLSWDFTGKQQQFEEKRQLWFKNIGTPVETILWLDDNLVTFWLEKDKQPQISYTLGISHNKKAATKFRRILHTLYPEEIKRYDIVYGELEEEVNNYNKIFKRSTKSN